MYFIHDPFSFVLGVCILKMYVWLNVSLQEELLEKEAAGDDEEEEEDDDDDDDDEEED